MEFSGEVLRLERGEIDPADFGHTDHVRLAFAMVAEAGFLNTLPRFVEAIKLTARRAGRSDAYNETITTAFLALIAERAAGGQFADYGAFAAANPDLLDKNCLDAYYSPNRLKSSLARITFLLPDRSAESL